MSPSSSSPPVARRSETVRREHGVARPDPYDWLADTESGETLDHLRAERAYYDAATAPLAGLVDTLTAELRSRLPREDATAPWTIGDHDYFEHRPEGAEYARLVRVARGAPADPADAEIVLDPVQFSDRSSFVGVGVALVSPDERTLAYSLDLTGGEVFELRFRDLATGEDLVDRVARSEYGGAWSADSRSFFYTVQDATFRPFQLWRHQLGTAVEDDALVLQEDDDQYFLGVRLTRSGAVIVVSAANRDTSEVWLIDAAAPTEPPRQVAPRRTGIAYDVEHARDGSGDVALIVTNDGALDFRVMRAPLATPGVEHWSELVPGHEGERIDRVDAFAGYAVVTVRRDGRLQLRVLSLDGATGPTAPALELAATIPGGSLTLAVNTRFDTSRVTVVEESDTSPRRWQSIDLDSGERRTVRETIVDGYDPAPYVTEVLRCPAADGTPIPVTIIRHRDTPLDATAPALIYSYGAYEIVVEPSFSETLASLLDRGVVYAHAHVRGGGEGGRGWWLDGRLEHKQNTFSDLIAVAEGLGSLVDPRRIATRGGSAGGLLQGALLSQRPDLWRAMIATVPFVDVVTTMLDDTLPLTAVEWDEWGDPRRAEEFGWMYAYSPYDNLPPAGDRPDLLVTGALHDPRVGVHEPAKWVAALRHSDPEWSPRCLFRCEVGEGSHRGAAGRLAGLRERAELIAWLLDRLDARDLVAR